MPAPFRNEMHVAKNAPEHVAASCAMLTLHVDVAGSNAWMLANPISGPRYIGAQ